MIGHRAHFVATYSVQAATVLVLSVLGLVFSWGNPKLYLVGLDISIVVLVFLALQELIQRENRNSQR
jgi:hypothetical protein